MQKLYTFPNIGSGVMSQFRDELHEIADRITFTGTLLSAEEERDLHCARLRERMDAEEKRKKAARDKEAAKEEERRRRSMVRLAKRVVASCVLVCATIALVLEHM